MLKNNKSQEFPADESSVLIFKNWQNIIFHEKKNQGQMLGHSCHPSKTL